MVETPLQKLLVQYRDEVSSLTVGDDSGLDQLRKKTRLLIRKAFGEKSQYLRDESKLSFRPLRLESGAEDASAGWESGKKQYVGLLDIMRQELVLNRAVAAEGGGIGGPKKPESDGKFERRYRIWAMVAPLLVTLVGSVLSFIAAMLGLMSSGGVLCQATKTPPPRGPWRPSLLLGLAFTLVVAVVVGVVIRAAGRRAVGRRSRAREANRPAPSRT